MSEKPPPPFVPADARAIGAGAAPEIYVRVPIPTEVAAVVREHAGAAIAIAQGFVQLEQAFAGVVENAAAPPKLNPAPKRRTPARRRRRRSR